MRRLILASVLLLAGCENVLGPFAHRQARRIDDPCLSIGEQERLGRDRLALPQESPNVAPPTYIDRPDPHGR